MLSEIANSKRAARCKKIIIRIRSEIEFRNKGWTGISSARAAIKTPQAIKNRPLVPPGFVTLFVLLFLSLYEFVA